MENRDKKAGADFATSGSLGVFLPKTICQHHFPGLKKSAAVEIAAGSMHCTLQHQYFNGPNHIHFKPGDASICHQIRKLCGKSALGKSLI